MTTRSSGRLRVSQYPVEEMEARASAFYEGRRRTVRQYARRPVRGRSSRLPAGGTAPSGANQQPWHFVVVEDAAVKKRIARRRKWRRRPLRRAPAGMPDALELFGTNEHKPFLETPPPDRDFRAELRRGPGEGAGQTLLRHGIGRYRHGHAHQRSDRGAGDADAHAKPDALS